MPSITASPEASREAARATRLVSRSACKDVSGGGYCHADTYQVVLVLDVWTPAASLGTADALWRISGCRSRPLTSGASVGKTTKGD